MEEPFSPTLTPSIFNILYHMLHNSFQGMNQYLYYQIMPLIKCSGKKICLLMPKISSWDEQWSLTGCFRLFLIWMLPPTKGTLILSQSLASQTPCVTWMDFFGGLSYDELPTIIRWICRVWLSFWRKETVDDGVMGILHDSLESIRNHTFEMMYTRPVSLSLFCMASFHLLG